MKRHRIIEVFALTAGLLFTSASAGWADGSPAACGFSGGNPDHGSELFAQTCSACHGADGHGAIPGTPDFTKKGGVLSESHTTLTDHIKNGFSSPGSPMAMPAQGGNPDLTDQDINDIHAYLHKRFGCG